jgi:hypothetical protein
MPAADVPYKYAKAVWERTSARKGRTESGERSEDVAEEDHAVGFEAMIWHER